MTREQLTAITGRISLEQAHEALTEEKVRRELYGQQDDMAEWSQRFSSYVMTGHKEPRRGQALSDERAWVDACSGHSCRQGRMPCRERCGAEMAVPDDDQPSRVTPHFTVAISVLALLAMVGGAWFFWLSPLY